VLEGIDVGGVGDYAAVEVVAAYRRQQAWAAARAAMSAADLARRPSMNPTWPNLGPRPGKAVCVAAEELAMRLALSRYAASRLVQTGTAYTSGVLTETGEALAAGIIDEQKAATIVTTLAPYDQAIAWAVEQEVLPGAATRTNTQLKADIARALIAVDPDDAEDRHRKARATRRVHHPRALPDGMASIYSVLPATDATSLDLALEAAARTARNNGDNRTIDQLRADALALLAHTALDTGWIGTPTP
ncbi:DUF222 domain-containing protein, partial [Georgenia sp. MJ206]|uniref:DUF222 domain-containing protein n=1 Tax=Georgenia wangjunii TaxID=3117730 RepID=UPI002F2667E2